MNINDFLDRNPKTVLMLSAGKDSAACLKMLRSYLHRILVVWVNQGNPYPETVEYMNRISKDIPHFHIVNGNQPEFIRKNGYPADVVPVQVLLEPIMFVPFTACCSANFWQPLTGFLKALEITGVIRGQKASDVLKSPAVSGTKIGGFEYFHPIEDWTDEDVVEFLGSDIPDSYRRGLHASLDCVNCTAYTADNGRRVAELERLAPSAYQEIITVHGVLKEKLAKAQELLNG